MKTFLKAFTGSMAAIGIVILIGVMAEVATSQVTGKSDNTVEFRGTQTTTAATYPSTGTLSGRFREICIKNDDAATDALYMRIDGTAASAAEADCDTAGCATIKIDAGESPCLDITLNGGTISLDGEGDGVPFRLTLIKAGASSL